MNDILKVINIVDVELQTALERLAAQIIDHASLKFDIEESDRQVLISNGVITQAQGKPCLIQPCNSIIYHLLKVYEQNGSFAFSADPIDWRNAAENLLKIKDGDANLNQQFYCFAIQYIDAFYPRVWSHIFQHDESDIWFWIRALNTTITSLNISSCTLYELAKSITEKHHNDWAIAQLYDSVKQFCQNDYNKGNEFLILCSKDLCYPLNNILIYCMLGLLENNYDAVIKRLSKQAENEKLRHVITYAFLNYVGRHPDKSHELFDKVDTFNEFRGDAALKFYWEIYRLGNDLQRQCESRLLDIIDNPTEDILNVAIDQLIYLDAVTDFVRNYIHHLTASEKFSIQHITLLDRSIAYRICDTGILIDIVRSLSRFKLCVDAGMLESCIREVSRKENDEFIYGVISLITDNNGMIRHLGRAIWDSSNLVNSSFDVLSLPEELQFSFIVSMLQDSGNPHDRLKKILPLFDSQSKFVPQLLSRQLIPYINNYMGAVIEELDALTIKNSEEVAKIKGYYKDRCSFIDKRIACKELDPFYTQCKVLGEFKRSDQEHMKGIMKEADKKGRSTLLDLFTSVLLAKGGGFRNEQGKVQELAHFSHSIPFPVMYASLNNLEESELNCKIFANWDNITDIWSIL